jgi:hypothetical protein
MCVGVLIHLVPLVANKLPGGGTGYGCRADLALRNVLVSTSFTHSPQNVTQADDPAAAAAGMGPYHPRAALCPLATLTAHGPQACPR